MSSPAATRSSRKAKRSVKSKKQLKKHSEQDDESDNHNIQQAENEEDTKQKPDVDDMSENDSSQHSDDGLDEATKKAIDAEAYEQFLKEEKEEQEEAILDAKQKKKEPTPGVIYISRPPKFMKPAKVKHLLGQYGTITNLFLQPEDKSAHRRRVKGGGNKKTVYTEGWVEFKRKSIAKQVALSLNNTRIGGNSRNFFADDIWNLKYLSGFKWSNLTEKVVFERKLREQRLKLELSKTKKENEFFLETVDKARELKKIEQRKKEAGTFVDKKANARTFRQINPVGGSSTTSTTKKLKTKFLQDVLGQSDK